jgi:nucleoside-diphosphate-sugar epimerase
MKLFLSGGTGFLGKHILERWDDSVYLYSRGEDTKSLKRYKPDIVIHAAAEIYQDDKMLDSNIVLTHNLLKEASNVKAFFYIGSSSEYGRKKKPMKETDLLEPQTMYEATKGAGSLLSQAYASTYGLPVMVLRPFSLYGKHEPKHRLIPTAIKSVKAGWPMDISPGSHDFIHVDDFIDAIFHLIENPHPGEIYNIGTGLQYTNEEVVNMIEKVVGRDIKKHLVGKLRPFDSDKWVCDYSKLARLGWKPKITLYEGIKKLI